MRHTLRHSFVASHWQRMENPHLSKLKKPMCVFLDFKSGCFKIHGINQSWSNIFTQGFTPLNILNILWRHPFAKFFAIHRSKSPSHHEILSAPWYFERPVEPRVSRVSDESSSYCWCFRNPKKTTTWHVWKSGKHGIFIYHIKWLISGIFISTYEHFMHQGACFENKILKNAILPGPSISMFWNVSLLWDCLLTP